MKTHLAVYEEGLFDLRGGKTFLRGGQMHPPPKETVYIIIGVAKYRWNMYEPYR